MLKQCCRMCGPGRAHACERESVTPFPIVESPGALDPAGPLDPRVQAELTELSGAPLTHANRVRLLRDGADTYTAMLELIESARTEILLENYIFRADAVGYGYSEALTARARDGVDVRILHDPFGDLLSLLPLHLHFRRSAARLSMYNPPRPTRRYLRAWRDHRKLLVQDRARLVAGGLCVADVWVGNCVRQCTWRDSAVLVEGAAAEQAADAFDEAWRDAFALTWRRWKGRQVPVQPAHGAGEVPIRVLADDPGRRCTEQALVVALNAAQFEVLVTNQYCVPTPRLTEAFIAAARRGVHVEIIVPPLGRPWFVGMATEHRLGRLLEAGVVAWRWTGAMMHAKTVVVDRRWSLIGSTNLDWLSLRRNAELNVEIHGGYVGEQMADMFATDRTFCAPFSLRQWRERPPARRAFTWALAHVDPVM
ncbi:MAG: phosphatidylserine/phosphatidylglycerophosphate/cardiolipin synthase family protein [Vicinamibacterales bacterium]